MVNILIRYELRAYVSAPNISVVVVVVFFFLQCMESHHYRVIPLGLAYLAETLNKMDGLMLLCCHQGSLVAQMVKNLPAVQEIWVLSLGWEDSLEKGMGTNSSILS